MNWSRPHPAGSIWLGLARDVAATVAREYLGVARFAERYNALVASYLSRNIFWILGNNPEMGSKAQLASAQLKGLSGCAN